MSLEAASWCHTIAGVHPACADTAQPATFNGGLSVPVAPSRISRRRVTRHPLFMALPLPFLALLVPVLLTVLPTQAPKAGAPSKSAFVPTEHALVKEGLAELRRHPDAPQRLLGPLGPAENPPTRLRAQLSAYIGPAPLFALRYRSAQRLDTTLGPSLWLIPGRGVTCLYHPKGGLGCQTTVSVVRSGLVLQSFRRAGPTSRSYRYLAMGLPPSGVTRVLLSTRGIHRVLTISRHIFVARAPTPLRVTFIPQGRRVD